MYSPTTSTQTPQNFFDHQIRPQQHIIVPEAQHAIPVHTDPSTTMLVLVASVHMLTTIQLNNQFRLDTGEVGDESRNRELTAELESRQATSLQVIP